MKKIVALSGALLFATTLARAETVVIHKDAPPPVAIERHDDATVTKTIKRSDGCRSASVTRHDDDGNSKTVTHTDC